MVLLLLGAGVLLSLVLGVWQWLRAGTLTAFALYQLALGLTDLLSQWLRGNKHSRSATAAAGLWLASLVALAVWPQPGCMLAAVATAALLTVVHRPDVALFAGMTLPVSLLLIGTALWRAEPFPYGSLALLVTMTGVFWWRR